MKDAGGELTREGLCLGHGWQRAPDPIPCPGCPGLAAQAAGMALAFLPFLHGEHRQQPPFAGLSFLTCEMG